MVAVLNRIEIQSGIAIPPIRSKELESKHRPNVSDIEKMKMGDSYAIPYKYKEEARRIGSYGHVYIRKIGGAAATRYLKENGKDVVRVWRIK